MASSYIGILDSKAAKLALSDPALTRIRLRSRGGHQVSFAWLRASFGADKKLHTSLDRGRAVLSSVDQLDQYLYSHGLMIQSQWEKIFKSFEPSENYTRLVDYGCGQGLAGILLGDLAGDKALSSVEEVVLIEPSAPALVRAEAVYRSLLPQADITCVNKLFDDLDETDLSNEASEHTLHMFSNVLDVNGYDHFQLLTRALVVGRHTILAVSHDREHDGGSDRIRALEAALRDPQLAGEVEIMRSEVSQFICDNPNKSAGISWICEMDVRDE